MSTTTLTHSSAGTGRRRGPLRVLGIAAGLLIGTLALAYAADVALARGRVPRGTRIAGVDVGGKSPAAAERLLERTVAARARQPVRVSVDGSVLAVDPARAGLTFDAGATLDRAGGAALNPWTRLTSLFRTSERPLVAHVEPERLRAEMARLARRVNRPPREGAVRFDGIRPVAVFPLPGRTLVTEASAVALARAYLQGDAAVPLAVRLTPVRSSAEGVRRALAEVAEPAVATPFSLEAGGRTVAMSPSVTAKALRIAAGPDGTIVSRFDPAVLEDLLDRSLAFAETRPRDARFDVVGGKVAITPSVTGRKVDYSALSRDLLAAVAQPAGRRIRLPIVDDEPRLSTARARTLGIKEVVGEFTTYHPCCRPRVRNIHKMADIVDGAVVLPGETFSLNGHVGVRDRARGFVEAPMILNGRFVDAVGGGVSQFATTMFNAVFFSGMQDVSHKAHSYYIGRYPAGREATVSSPAPDLKWRNDSRYGVLVTTAYTDTSITVRFWSTKRYDIESISGPRTRIRSYSTQYDPRPDCQSTSGVQGFDIVVWRVFRQQGVEVRRERFFTRYLPEPRFVCRRSP